MGGAEKCGVDHIHYTKLNSFILKFKYRVSILIRLSSWSQVHNIPSKTVSTYLLFSSSFLLLLTVSAPCTEASLLQSSSQVFSCLTSFSLEAYSFRNSTKLENSTRWRLKSWLIMLLLTTLPLNIRTGAQNIYRTHALAVFPDVLPDVLPNSS